MNKYTILRETALLNFERLLKYWGIQYVKINHEEYDFINPLRNDSNFGACRFNTKKGIGADFAGNNISDAEYSKFASGFTKEDFIFIGGDGTEDTNRGFDVIGLCGRLFKLNNYQESARRLTDNLKEIETNDERGILKITPKIIKEKEQQREVLSLKKLQNASRTWSSCENITNTVGEKYLQSRGIFISGESDSIKYKERIYNSETSSFIPALLFRVSTKWDGELCAIHRIYLSPDGLKANLNQPKMALGSIKGAGIWFGEVKDKLYIAEGPENALSILSMGRFPVVSTINATNFGNLFISDSVTNIILCPDNDKAGIYNSKKALKNYAKKVRNRKIAKCPPNKDWNDLLIERMNGEKE